MQVRWVNGLFRCLGFHDGDGSIGNLSTLKSEAIETTYRSCPMLSEHIAIEATFEALPASEGRVRAIMDVFATQRRGSQPIGASAGRTSKKS